MLTAASFWFACILSDAIDRFARPARSFLGGGAVALFFRCAAVGWLWSLAMTISQRPAFSLLAVLVTVTIFVVISNLKASSLAEPLVFSDFAFVAEIVRHPRLFYLERWAVALICLIVVGIVALTTVWWHLEDRVLGPGGLCLVAAVVVLGPILPLLGHPGAALDSLAAKAAPAPRLDAHLTSLGLLASLVVYWIRWCQEGRVWRTAALRHSPATLADAGDYEAIVVIQAESFVDLRRLGYPEQPLPTYDRLKARARASGLLEVPCVGAYTLRPEAAVITGHGFERARFSAFHPYLRSRLLAPFALPNRLPSTWRAIFVHPYLSTFFLRRQAIPQFGFADFADQSRFASDDRDGPYVGDVAVGRHIVDALAEARRDGRKLFVQVITMEAHDPYGPGRLAHEGDPTRQFVHHLRNADRMLALLAENLDVQAERVLLIHYGDHVPVLKDFADPFPDTRTDFLVVELGRAARRGALDRTIRRPEDLHHLLLSQFEAEKAPNARVLVS